MDTYQAIYDAVRSKISNGDVGAAITDACRQNFDISHAVEAVKQELLNVAYEHQRPSAIYRPALSLDGNQWCALYGEDLQAGVSGFGDSPDSAMRAFDKAWHAAITAAMKGEGK